MRDMYSRALVIGLAIVTIANPAPAQDLGDPQAITVGIPKPAAPSQPYRPAAPVETPPSPSPMPGTQRVSSRTGSVRAKGVDEHQRKTIAASLATSMDAAVKAETSKVTKPGVGTGRRGKTGPAKVVGNTLTSAVAVNAMPKRSWRACASFWVMALA